METFWVLVLFSSLILPGPRDAMAPSKFLAVGDRNVSLTERPRSRVSYREDCPVARLARTTDDGRLSKHTCWQDKNLDGSSAGRTLAVSDRGWEWRRMRDGWQPWPPAPVNVAPSDIASRASQLHPGVLAVGLALFSIFALLACEADRPR